jgi:hypothetical protein
MRNFTGSPVTVETQHVDGRRVVRIGSRASYGKSPENESPYVAEVWTNGEVHFVPLSAIEHEKTGYLIATPWPDEGQVHIRETLPSDAVLSANVPSGIPLPLEVISTMVAEPINAWSSHVEVTMHAACDDDGFVSTMLLVAPSGMYARYDAAWIEVSNPDLFDGLNLFDVEDGALSVYDEYDQTSGMIHVGMLPLSDEEDADRVPRPTPVPGPVDESDLVATAPVTTTPDEIDETPPPPATPTEVATVPQPPGPAPLTSAAMITSPSQIKSIDDVPGAITAAAANPGIRWFVERRARALGYTEEFPW